MSALKKGDYVLATKWFDGSPHDQWCVGFFDGMVHDRFLVIDCDGNPFRHNGFRRCEVVTSDEGRKLLDAFAHANKKDMTLWAFIGREPQPKARWSSSQRNDVTSQAVDDFLTDLLKVYEKHGLSLAIAGGHGSFEVNKLSDTNIRWLENANNETGEGEPT